MTRPHDDPHSSPHAGTYGEEVMPKRRTSLSGQRILITGAARGIGAALARSLTHQGAYVGLLGIEPELLAAVANDCGTASGPAPWRECDVTDADATEKCINDIVAELGGLDVIVANAGVAAQLPLVGGNPEIFRRTIEVNLMGVYNTVRAAGPHISHKNGYALLVSSLAAAINLPLLGAYSASKAAVEALGNTLRTELHPYGATAGVAYFGELDTEMTSRGFGTEAAKELTKSGPLLKVAPLAPAIRRVERGIARRSRIIAAPWYVRPLLPMRPVAQRVIDVTIRRNLASALEIARAENAPLTTAQRETVLRPPNQGDTTA
nr:SDR family NAD(P)-dependent oxidoreductase [Hoyosella rhizosphaerae]